MNESKFEIYDVAIYIRKSRGEEEDLAKHEDMLKQLCIDNNWRYRVFKEVGSSQNIEERSQMTMMLEDINNGEFDAIAVVDKERLSREGVSQAYINKTLVENDCLIITPSRIYDLSNETDYMQSEFEDMFSRIEYRMIKKRLKRGKKLGAKRGNWVNGIPPIPYVYNRETKGLDVDDEKLIVYRKIIEMFLNNHSPNDISWELNKLGISSPKNTFWTHTNIRRILVDETHLGKIVYNKTKTCKKNGRNQVTINERDKWIIVDNCHRPVKTEREHLLICEKIESKKTNRKNYKGGKYDLSGLITCGKCGKAMSLHYRERKSSKSNTLFIKTCQTIIDYKNNIYCGNEGFQLDMVRKEIFIQMQKYQKELQKISDINKNVDIKYGIEKELSKKEKQISEVDSKIEKVTDLVLAGFFTPEEAINQKNKLKEEYTKLENELISMRESYKQIIDYNISDRLVRINEVVEKLRSLNLGQRELNDLYKSILDSIIWEKDDDIIKVTLNFL